MQTMFINPQLSPMGLAPVPNTRLFSRYDVLDQLIEDSLKADIARLERGEYTGDMDALNRQIAQTVGALQRAITSTTANLPIRENLEAEAKLLIPIRTPLRNRLPRIPGAGSAVAWRQITSIGGGYAISTTVTTGASSTTQQLGSTAGILAGDSLYFATSNAYRIVSSITDSTHLVLTATISTTTSEIVTKGPYNQPGSGGTVRAFFTESGAPADHSTTYAAKSAAYKLLGSFGSVTGFAMATGANFQNQLATEKTNQIMNTMLNEENALINSDSSVTASPWGDGSTAMGFDGLLKQVSTANGTPAEQVQTSVGPLTTAFVDQMLTRQWNQGAENPWIMCNAQETNSFNHLAEGSGTIIRVMGSSDADAILGVKVIGYKHPMTGEIVPILTSQFMPAGTMVFGCDKLPKGNNSLEVNVLPQVQLPDLAPNTMIQGYTAQELAPTTTAPQVYPFIVSVYETLAMKSSLHFAKGTGLTAV